MKKTFGKYLAVLAVICIAISAFAINAFAAGTSIAFSKNSLNVGDTLTVTVRFSASSDMYAVQAQLKYDTSVLQFVSAKNGSGSGGIVTIAGSANGKNASEDIVFKAIGTGKTSLSVLEAGYSDGGPIESITGCSATVEIVDRSASKSSDANLKYITPSAGSLTPKFSASVTTYSITIPNSVKTLTVGAGTSHSGAEWDVEGSKDMKVGSNKRVIVVTAEDGTEKRYTLNITRLAADGTTPEPDVPDTENPTDEKTSVTADGQDKYIANEFDTQNLFPGYAVDVFHYNDKEFPCIKKDDSVLVYLTDIDGANGDFYRPLEDGSFTVFTFMMSESKFYEFLTPDEIPEGYSEITMDIAGYKVTAYQSIDPTLSEFALIYAKGPDGNTGFYRYDTVEHTLQRVVDLNASQPPTDTDGDKKDGTIWENIMSMDTSTKVVAITIVGVILLLIVAIIVLIVKIVKASRYEEELEYEQDMVVEEDDTSDFEFISISDRDSYDEE